MGVWLGRKRIPPLPNETVLTDRSDGKFWRVVNTDGEPDIVELQSVDRKKYWLYEAYRGPIIRRNDGTFFQLYVDDGTLSVEESDIGRRTAPVFIIDGRRPLDVKEVEFAGVAITTESGEPITDENDEVITIESETDLAAAEV